MLLDVDCWRKHGLTGEDAITVATTWVLAANRAGVEMPMPRHTGCGTRPGFGEGPRRGAPQRVAPGPPYNFRLGIQWQAEAGYTVLFG
jgi:hypothetical protein